MSLIDALIHLVNLFLPAALLGAFSAGLVKLCWWRELKAARWHRLAGCAAAAAALATIAGLVFFGRDGRMATYAVMVCASAAALWLAAFGPWRR